MLAIKIQRDVHMSNVVKEELGWDCSSCLSWREDSGDTGEMIEQDLWTLEVCGVADFDLNMCACVC